MLHCVMIQYGVPWYILPFSRVYRRIFSFQLAPADQNALRVAMLEKMLREDIDRELEDLSRLEQHHQQQKEWFTQKKRQLEIKKRRPVQCLVNIVSCWKK